MTNHLRNALDALLAERQAVAEQQKKLARRLEVIEQGVESLSSLLADSEPSNPVQTVAQLTARAQPAPEGDGATPLWKLVSDVLAVTGPLSPRLIGDTLIGSGYETTSKDFTNVIGTVLRGYPKRFRKLEDGRWENLAIDMVA